MRGPPVFAERPGRTKPRFRDGGGEHRGFQTRQRRVKGGVGLERLWSHLQRRRDLDQAFPELRLSPCSTEGGYEEGGCWIEPEPRCCCRRRRLSGRLGSASLWLPPLTRAGLKSRLPEILETMDSVVLGYGAVWCFLEAAGGPAMTETVAGIGMPEINAAAGHGQEDGLEKSLRDRDPSLELGLTVWLNGLVSGPVMNGPWAQTGLQTRTGPIGLQYENGGYMLQTLKMSPRSNLMPRLSAMEEAAYGAGSNPTGKGLALS